MDSATLIAYLRQFKIGGFTIFDTTASFLGVYILTPLLTKSFRLIGFEIPRKSWLYLVLPIGIIAHSFSSTKTPMTKEFFDPDGHYPLKLIILILLVLGLKDVKRIGKGAAGDSKAP